MHSGVAISRQAFLDQRGEEYDDWYDKDALIVKAQECEVNTGPATNPPLLAHEQAQVTREHALSDPAAWQGASFE